MFQISAAVVFVVSMALAGGCASPAATAAAPSPGRVNRDPHGPPDVNQYIAALSDPKRDQYLPLARVVELLKLHKDARVADLGCGPGLASCAIAKAVPDGVVFAIDVEPAQLDALNIRIRNENARNVVPVLCVTDDPRLPPSSVDCIVIIDTFHHFDDRVNYLKNLARALRPGGRIVNIDYKEGKLAVGPPPEHKLAKDTWLREFADAGFIKEREETEFTYHDFVVFRAPVR